MQPAMSIKVSELPLEVLYSKQLDELREPYIARGVDPRPVTFQYILQFPSRRLKAIKLQPYGHEEEDANPPMALYKEDAQVEEEKRNKAVFVNKE